MQGHLAQPSPASELINRVVAPFVKAAPDPAQESILAAIDGSLSGAMRTILHHPDFQSVEATWRSLDLLSRRVETSASMEIVLYDVSAEEWRPTSPRRMILPKAASSACWAEEPRLDETQGAFERRLWPLHP